MWFTPVITYIQSNILLSFSHLYSLINRIKVNVFDAMRCNHYELKITFINVILLFVLMRIFYAYKYLLNYDENRMLLKAVMHWNLNHILLVLMAQAQWGFMEKKNSNLKLCTDWYHIQCYLWFLCLFLHPSQYKSPFVMHSVFASHYIC